MKYLSTTLGLVLMLGGVAQGGEYIDLDQIAKAPAHIESPIDMMFEGEMTGEWMCKWFPVVDHGNYLTRIIDKRNNTVTITWDNNGDGHFDIQYTYRIAAFSPGEYYPIIGPVPWKIWYDIDKDQILDLTLVNESGKGMCSEWRSVPINRHQPQSKPLDCVTNNCDTKEKGST